MVCLSLCACRDLHSSNTTAVRERSLGSFVQSSLWPLVSQLMAAYAGHDKVVESSSRALKHAMRCAPDFFKPAVPHLKAAVVEGFKVGDLDLP